MPQLDDIKEPVKEHISAFNIYFRETLRDDREVVQEVVDYILKMQGKQMRPLFILLSAAMHGELEQRSYVAATLIELTHTASLIHDDIVDEAYTRRSKWSVAALWRSKLAVLAGDYILARGIRVAVANRMYTLIDTMSTVIEQMSRGELMQSDSARRLNISRDDYFEVIRCKTAVLMGASAEAGAMSVEASQEQCRNMYNFGEKLGIAFQIKDDIMDYTSSSLIGKPICNDIRENKMTLPLIIALEKLSESERGNMLSLVHRAADDESVVRRLRSFVVASGAIDESRSAMTNIKNEAMSLIADYPDTEYKRSMELFASYVLDRDK